MQKESDFLYQRELHILRGSSVIGLDLTEADSARIFNAYLSINAQEDLPTNPEHLYHIEQVYLIGINILNTMPDSTCDNVKKVTEKAFSHDIGRAWDNGFPHLLFGKEALTALGTDPALAEYAIAHHKWGLIDFEATIISNIPKKEWNLQEIVEGEKDHLLEPLFKSIYQKLTEKYGMEGMVILIADNSKAYNNPHNIYMPSITLFNSAQALELIEAQLKRGRYIEGSLDHLIEIVGTRFAHYIINKLTKDHGVDYERAIDTAQKQWPDQSKKVDQAWEAALELNCEVYGL